MKILTLEVEKSNLTKADFKPYLKEEAAAVWKLTQAGIIREIYFRADRHSAVMMLEVNNLDDAKIALNELPLVKAGLINFDIFTLKPYDGFECMFDKTVLKKNSQNRIRR